jgi:anti-sigma regulatory factor (Ser/Thr protein kinase)
MNNLLLCRRGRRRPSLFFAMTLTDLPQSIASLRPEPSSVRDARRFVRSTLEGWHLDTDQAALMTSELATNAVLHARTEYTVTVTLLPARVRVEVADLNPRPPAMAPPLPLADSGRGLRLLQTLAPAWGTELNRDRKTVWFEIDRVAVPRKRPPVRLSP